MKTLITISLLLFFSFALAGQIAKSDDGLYYDVNGDLYTGVYTETYPDGIPKAEISLVNGQRHGVSKIYYENGHVRDIQSYKNNLMHGKWESFNKEGVRIAEAHYRMGKKDGKWLIWDDNGTLRYDMTYKNREKTGVWYIYDESGKLVASTDYK
jgi:antitoxin component YwqK of YwqJK toxin-antitoxin module